MKSSTVADAQIDAAHEAILDDAGSIETSDAQRAAVKLLPLAGLGDGSDADAFGGMCSIDGGCN